MSAMRSLVMVVMMVASGCGRLGFDGVDVPDALKAPSSVCGDQIVDPDSEQCDSGGVDTATCNGALCTTPKCGDGYTNAMSGEQCDNGAASTATCNGNQAGTVSCHTPTCGDNYANTAAGEQCDKGAADTAACNGNQAGAASCHTSTCGDGHVNKAAGEQCEVDTDCTGATTCQGCRCL